MKTYEPRPNPNNIPPHPKVMSRRGRIKPHPYEPPHDEPSGSGPCWDCVLPEKHPVHTRGPGEP